MSLLNTVLRTYLYSIFHTNEEFNTKMKFLMREHVKLFLNVIKHFHYKILIFVIFSSERGVKVRKGCSIS